MSKWRTLLMVLMAVRLLMPPGICACKWSSPAARLLVALVQSQRQIPTEENRDENDDHDAGCPASPLAAGMGVKPATEPLLPPTLALDPPPTEATPILTSAHVDSFDTLPFDPPPDSLYLTFRTLLI